MKKKYIFFIFIKMDYGTDIDISNLSLNEEIYPRRSMMRGEERSRSRSRSSSTSRSVSRKISNGNNYFKIKTINGDIVNINLVALKNNTYIFNEGNSIILNILKDTDDKDFVFEVKYSTKIMTLINEYLDYYKDYEIKYVYSDDDKTGVPVVKNLDIWDEIFFNDIFNKSKSQMYELIIAANFLTIDTLIEDSTQYIANKMNKKSTEELRELLDIKNDITPEFIEKEKELGRWPEEENVD